MIRTTKKAREYYEKHLEQLDESLTLSKTDRENLFEFNYTCYMCLSADTLAGDIITDMCDGCPLGSKYQDGLCCATGLRRINLRNENGAKTNRYENATPSSIKKHADWIADQITKYTDCEMK